ncbi:MAG: hypothetical protein ISQ03_06185 [Pseudomonadales bacterium]|jgi:hypothetical protein|nr:hypothetical protein [Pseudomonadales bacterium]MBL6808150.1 hypothetical protein [Pseudomonadales bacterium]
MIRTASLLLGALLLAAPALAARLDAELGSLRLEGRAVVPELSGLATSQSYPGILWAHGDSGQAPVLWALDLATGALAFPPYLAERFDNGASWPGLTLEGASNIDWEDLTLLDGWLYVGDVGNNGNARRDLGLWALPEPNPRATERQRPAFFLPVHYPEQKRFPAGAWEFDAEALFADPQAKALYLITKHRKAGDVRRFVPGAKLYRIPLKGPRDESIALELVDRNDELTAVTAAALSPSGRWLAVLTYRTLWVFPRPEAGARWLSGEALSRPLPFLETRQAEALSWRDERTLLLGNEEGRLWTVSLNLPDA